MFLIFHQTFLIVNHAFAGIFSGVKLACVHTDSVFGTNLDAKAAIDTLASIEDKCGWKFFNVGIGMLGRGDFNATGRTNGFSHHAGDTTGRAVFAFR